MCDLPDVHKTVPSIEMRISKVGVENVELPFLLDLRDGSYSQVIAKATMTCELNDKTRGVSMSRFIRTLKPYLKRPLKRLILEDILKDLTASLETNKASLKFSFKLLRDIQSPISDNKFPHFYQCSFRSDYSDSDLSFYQSVRVQYSAYCPCSAELCKTKKSGYPHNQRAFANVLVRTNPKHYIWLEDIIDLVENAVVTLPYPIIKRNDEAYMAGIAQVYPQFVEDAIRKISTKLNKMKGIVDWYVKCTHEESIHMSNAIAINWKGNPYGFNETTYV